ncbi:MAG: lamin tail domain-containing protein [Patescibacteria group bacterium]
MDSFYSYKETKIPVRVALVSLLIAGLMFGTALQAVLIGAEAHVVSVTARILSSEEPSVPVEQLVVLNEILPNLKGADGQDGLLGEWVELYNNGDFEVDVAGWYIEDASVSGNRQTISLNNTHTGDTIIGAAGSGQEWLVVFMAGAIFNNTGDTASLFNADGVLKDSHAFGISVNDTDSDAQQSPREENVDTDTENAGQEGKAIARIPDGTGEWVDPIPTPGGPNRMEEELASDEPPANQEEEVLNEEASLEEGENETKESDEERVIEDSEVTLKEDSSKIEQEDGNGQNQEPPAEESSAPEEIVPEP